MYVCMYVCNRLAWGNTTGVPGFGSFSESTFNLSDPYLPTHQSLLSSYFNNQPHDAPHTYMPPPYGPMESTINTTNMNKNTIVSGANTINTAVNTMSNGGNTMSSVASNTANTMGYGGNTMSNGGNTMGYGGNTIHSVGNTMPHSNSAPMSNMPKLIYNAKADSVSVVKAVSLEQFAISSNYQVTNLASTFHTYIHTYIKYTYIHTNIYTYIQFIHA